MTVTGVRRRVRLRQPQLEGVEVALNFTGGLRLDRQGMLIDTTAVPEARNVDFMPDGGFCMRSTVRPFHPNDLPGRPCWLGQFEPSPGGSAQLLASLDNGSLFSSTGDGQPLTLVGAVSGSACWRGVESNFRMYLQNGVDPPVRWDGSTATVLGQGFNSNYLAPTGGNMPIARFIAVHRGHLWHFDVLEGATRLCSRVRFSFPIENNQGGEDYHPDDYIDLDEGADGQCATGLVACGDRLFALKEHSVYELTGEVADNIGFDPVSRTIGAAGPNAWACCGDALYMWDSSVGLTRLEVKQLGIRIQPQLDHRISYPILPILERMEVDDSRAHQVSVGCCGTKVMVSVPMRTGERLTFVYDPTVGQDGAWTCYDLQLGAFLQWRPARAKSACLAVNEDGTCPPRVLAVDGMGDQDDCGNGLRDVRARLVTAWFTDKQPQLKKRYRCVQIVHDDSDGKAPGFTVDVHGDWNSGKILTSIEIPAVANPPPFTVGLSDDCSKMVGPQWERIRPGVEPTPVRCVEYEEPCPVLCGKGLTVTTRPMRTCSLQSVQLDFRSRLPSRRWCVRGIVFKYRVDARQC